MWVLGKCLKRIVKRSKRPNATLCGEDPWYPTELEAHSQDPGDVIRHLKDPKNVKPLVSWEPIAEVPILLMETTSQLKVGQTKGQRAS